MGNETITVESEIDTEQLSEMIGNQLILNGRGMPFAYLAGIALDGMNDDDRLDDILIEFMNNSQALDFTDQQRQKLFNILRNAYNE